MPEHEGARGEWDQKCEERREAAACIIKQRDYIAVSALNNLISKSHPSVVIPSGDSTAEPQFFPSKQKKWFFYE
jgi:hypothetical protein